MRLLLGLAARQRWPLALDWLRPGEQERLKGFGSDRRRQTFLAGRWLLRELLADALGGSALAQRVDVDAEGRSHAATGHVNLSHSGDWCVAAWSSEALVGVDLEVLRPRTGLMAIAERVASEQECAQLAAMVGPPQLEAFYRLWTLKEAWLKSHGQGLDFALMRRLAFEPAEADINAASVHLPRAGLQISVCSAGLASLPERLADEPLQWRGFRQLTP